MSHRGIGFAFQRLFKEFEKRKKEVNLHKYKLPTKSREAWSHLGIRRTFVSINTLMYWGCPH